MHRFYLIGGLAAMVGSLVLGGIDTCPWTSIGFIAGALFAMGLNIAKWEKDNEQNNNKYVGSGTDDGGDDVGDVCRTLLASHRPDAQSRHPRWR